MYVKLYIAFFAVILYLPLLADAQQNSEQQLREKFAAQLKQAGENETELIEALTKAPQEHRSAIGFLVSNLNPEDLENVTGQLLLDNVRLAYEAKSKMPWGDKIPEETFFNDVLPHFNIDEKREMWRRELYDLCLPIVADCQTPSEAALRLNEQLFKKLGVKYSTARKKANQSPSESIEQGLASCTGLSVLLTDACRSVCVPARIAGIPSWPNKRGNHTWVEIWDGKWYFTGAAEPDKQGLNHTWFLNDVALADKSSRLHSVYAVSFKKTDTVFPLVWSLDKENPVYAVNVTERYADPVKIAAYKAIQNTVQTRIRVFNHDRTTRMPVNVLIAGINDDKTNLTGVSRNEQADMNDILSFDLPKNSQFELQLNDGAESCKKVIATGSNSQNHFDITFPDGNLVPADQPTVVASVKEYFAADEQVRIDWQFPLGVELAYRNKAKKLRQAIWESYVSSPDGQANKQDFEKHRVTNNEHVSPYTIKDVGTRPENGWPLFIAMHGGGGAPKRVNDSQWEHMQIYYKDQEGVEGYKYLALRAPNDTWNGFYDDYVYPLIENLIRQQIVHGDIDPNKVFIMGYSHGGYGAFAIGPKIPYRFAAIHSSAAAPTDGETSAKTLRNTRFSFMVGEKDDAYGRRERCEKFAEQIKQLKGDRDDVYPVEFMYQPGFGHGGLPDRDMISQMFDHKRNVTPKHLTWEMTDAVIDRFFWLSVDDPGKSKLVDAQINDNIIDVKTENVDQFSIFVDERLIKPGSLIQVNINGVKSKEVKYSPTLNTFCEALIKTGDINLAFDYEIDCR